MDRQKLHLFVHTEYPEECDPDNMQIVAFISNLDTKNPVNCEIANGTKVNLPQLSASSIDNIGKTVQSTKRARMYMIYRAAVWVRTPTVSPQESISCVTPMETAQDFEEQINQR